MAGTNAWHDKRMSLSRVFGLLMDRAAPVVQAFRSDFFYDAEKLREITRDVLPLTEVGFEPPQVTFYFGVRQSGTSFVRKFPGQPVNEVIAQMGNDERIYSVDLWLAPGGWTIAMYETCYGTKAGE